MKMGALDFTSTRDIGVWKWKDRGKKYVCLVSTMQNPGEISQVLRTNKHGVREPVLGCASKGCACPVSIKEYKFTCGVDLFDQLHSAYNNSWTSRRWWMKLFYYFLDASIVNTYALIKSVAKSAVPKSKPLSHLKFRSRLLADELNGAFCIRQKPGPTTQASKGRKRNNPDECATLTNVKRLDNVGERLPVTGRKRR